jgi:hypothetical protein
MADYEFPQDLIELQRAWDAADARRTAAARDPDDDYDAAHAAALDAVEALNDHEYWETVENRHEAKQALRKVARTQEAPAEAGA